MYLRAITLQVSFSQLPKPRAILAISILLNSRAATSFWTWGFAIFILP